MAEFQEVMRQWNRMCNSVPDKKGQNICFDKQSGYICPMHTSGLCNKSISRQTDNDRVDGEKTIMLWAAEHPEPVYPTFREWLISIGVIGQMYTHSVIADKLAMTPIPADIAQKLGIEPKEKT